MARRYNRNSIVETVIDREQLVDLAKKLFLSMLNE